MVPGKQYTPEDFLLIAWRRKWLIVLPFIVVAMGTIAYSRSLSSLYRSETLILVMPQRVPQSYVQPTVTTQIDQRLAAISQQVQSRSRLEQLIQEFNLYPQQRSAGIMDEVIQKMRTDITVDIIRASRDAQGGTSFRVSYVSPDPQTAMRVTEKLASLFIEANLRDRELLAEGTDQFIELELVAARTRLEEQERAIEEYRSRHPWDQADEVDNNRWMIVNTQQWIANLQNALNGSRDRLLFLEKLVADLTAQSAEIPVAVAGSDASTPLSAAAQLEAAKSSLQAMKLRLKAEHPDVQAAERTIVELTRKAEQEALSRPLSPDGSVAQSAPPQQRERLFNIQNEMAVLRRRISDGEAEERRAQELLAAQRQRVDNYPVRAREMAALTRDVTVVRNHYHDLLRKKESAKIAANLERQQIGEQMRIVDPARVPQRPFSPDRGRINLLGAALGLGLGLGLAALFEYRDTSLRTDGDVLAALSLPVLALVPVMRTTTEIRRARRRTLIWSLTGAVTLVVSAAAAVFWSLGS